MMMMRERRDDDEDDEDLPGLPREELRRRAAKAPKRVRPQSAVPLQVVIIEPLFSMSSI